MVWAVIENHKGQREDFRKPCFGFMSYIHQWYETDEWDDEEDDWEYEYLEGFEPAELNLMHYFPDFRNHMPSQDLPEFREKYLPVLLEAVKLLPQYYSNVEYTAPTDSTQETFTFALQDANMQTTIIGAMMLRNIAQYSGMRRVFRLCVDAGLDPVTCFVMGNMYSSNYCSFGADAGKYLANPVHYGDESIFPDETRACDIQAFIDGKLGHIYQGVWGDTENGYGRYGEYDGDTAPRFERTGNRSTITDTLLLADDYVDSPLLMDIEIGVCSSARFSDEELIVLAGKITGK
ncbi:hypothetical protein ECO319P1_00030 [Escherichia phage ECO319P1]|nr:hypothetical protein ECO319P1_00030 [Escherichia phage ECO319P1]